jgi:long-subunit fatty acid transport protein
MRAVRIAVATLAFTSTAAASTELPLRYNARSLAMGGTGVAFVDDASAIAINPARLDWVPNFSAVATMAPFMPRNEVPFSEGTRQKGVRSVVPLFFAGAAGRVLERLTIGGAAYVVAGAGSEYEDIPEYNGLDMLLEVGVIEFAIPVAYRVTNELSVGVALRGAYCFLTTDMPVDIGAGGPLRLEQSLSGFGAPGVMVGLSWHPSKNAAFGATYRSKMTIDLEGEGQATHAFFNTLCPGGTCDAEIESKFATAHVVRFGAAVSFLEQRLTLALDVSHALLSDSYEKLPLAINLVDLPNTQVDPEITLGWRDSQALSFGTEYKITHTLAGRLGYQLTRSGTPNETASPLAPPPGTIHGFHAGAGYSLTDAMRVDLGGAYAFGGADVTRSVNGPKGRYDGDYILLAGSFTYRN